LVMNLNQIIVYKNVEMEFILIKYVMIII
jgi:hypothetical protein